MRNIAWKGKVVARVGKILEQEGIQFLTEADGFLQVGVHNRGSADDSKPHVHQCVPFTVNRIEEVFFVVSGSIKVTLYDEKTHEVVEAIVMHPSDVMIHFGGGHGVEFLEKTVMFEVKQGPFQGNKKGKTYLQPVISPKKLT